MPPCLFYHPMPRIHQNYGRIGRGGPCYHVSGILNMARGIGNNKFSFRCCEISVGHVNRYALFSFVPQSICKQGQINPIMPFLFTGIFDVEIKRY